MQVKENKQHKQARKPEYPVIRRAKLRVGEGETDEQKDAYIDSLIQRWRDQANQ